MSLLTVADLKTHIPVVQSGVQDAALQRILDYTEQLITIYRGGEPATAVTERVRTHYLRIAFLQRRVDPAETITLTEIDGSSSVELASDDYHLRTNLMAFDRLGYGTHPRDTWGEWLLADYTPEDDTDQRKLVQVDLAKLELAINGYMTIGTQSEQRTGYADPTAMRRLILAKGFAEQGWGPR